MERIAAAAVIHFGVQNDLIHLWFKYNETVLGAVRSVSGRRWDPVHRIWTVPLQSGNALKAALDRVGAKLQRADKIPEDGRDAAAKASSTPIQPGTIRLSRISFARMGGDIRIMFDYQPAMVNLVKHMPRRWYSGVGQKFWAIPESDFNIFKGLLQEAQWGGTLWDEDFQRAESLEDTGMHLPSGTVLPNERPVTEEDPEAKAAREEAERRQRELADFEEAFRCTTVPDIDISDVDFCAVSGEVMPHQKDFMRFAKARLQEDSRGILVCDEQGLGKTLEAINLALYLRKTKGIRHCLIICCVNSNVRNWADEIYMHTQGKEEACVLGQKKRADGSYSIGGSDAKLEDLKRLANGQDDFPFFLVTNIETLRKEETVEPRNPDKPRKGKPRKKYPVETQIKHLIESKQIGAVIVDEVHKNTSPQAKQGRILWRIYRASEKDKNCCWVPMTGTPLVNQPNDLFLPLGLAGGHDFTSADAFRKYFCPNDARSITQCQNLGELRLMLTRKMIRRTKDDALQLPPKVHKVEYVRNTPYQKALYKRIQEQMLAEFDDEEVSALPNPLTALLQLRQVTGNPELLDDELVAEGSEYLQKNAKMRRIVELMREILEDGEKAIIFSQWERALHPVIRYAQELTDTAVVTGKTKDADRKAEIQRFQNDPACGIICGTIGAMGVGLTLTAASHVIFLDEPWTPAAKEQAEDRAHRIGTTGTVCIHTLITEDTVDQRVHDMIFTKKQTADLLVDGHIQIGGSAVNVQNNPALIRHLIEGDMDGYEDD